VALSACLALYAILYTDLQAFVVENKYESSITLMIRNYPYGQVFCLEMIMPMFCTTSY